MKSKREYEAKNARRCELIQKQSTSLTAEERRRPFASHPGWEEECNRRQQEALTPEEHTELATLTKECGDWIEKTYPRPDASDKLLDALEASVERNQRQTHALHKAKDALEAAAGFYSGECQCRQDKQGSCDACKFQKLKRDALDAINELQGI